MMEKLTDGGYENFDDIMEAVGNDGPFQRRYNYVFNGIAIVFFGMSFMNMILVLNEPVHHCRVPGRENFNISNLDLWKNITLPSELNNKGELTLSSCKMYNVTETHLWSDYKIWNFTDDDVIECEFGYEFDKTYYERTPVTDYEWMCNKETYVTNLFTINKVSEVIGSLVLGRLGDTIGRLPVYFIGIVTVVIGRLLAVLSSGYYVVFSIAMFMGFFAINTTFSSPLIIAMEISKNENRASVNLVQLLSWTVGVCFVPFIFWLTKNWISFLLVTSVPSIFLLLLNRYNIESPTWLASRGKYKECIKILKQISKINGKDFTITEEDLHKLSKTDTGEEQGYGVLSLFTNFSIAKITISLIICWIAYGVPVAVLVLLCTRIEGNPFMNFFWQSVVEFPAYLFAQYCCDKIGRRLTHFMSFAGVCGFCIPVLFFLTDDSGSVIITVLTAIIKFFNCITFFVICLQGVEIYPTCLRQTTSSIGVIVGQSAGIFGPYIVLAGTRFSLAYPYIIMGSVSFIGALSCLQIPETLHKNLPETIEDMAHFVKNQKFWQLPTQKPTSL